MEAAGNRAGIAVGDAVRSLLVAEPFDDNPEREERRAGRRGQIELRADVDLLASTRSEKAAIGAALLAVGGAAVPGDRADCLPVGRQSLRHGGVLARRRAQAVAGRRGVVLVPSTNGQVDLQILPGTSQ